MPPRHGGCLYSTAKVLHLSSAKLNKEHAWGLGGQVRLRTRKTGRC